jgi:hypothetical protein
VESKVVVVEVVVEEEQVTDDAHIIDCERIRGDFL